MVEKILRIIFFLWKVVHRRSISGIGEKGNYVMMLVLKFSLFPRFCFFLCRIFRFCPRVFSWKNRNCLTSEARSFSILENRVGNKIEKWDNKRRTFWYFSVMKSTETWIPACAGMTGTLDSWQSSRVTGTKI
jgi:hypothetical protein